jgi:hypothetical protein
VARVIILSRRWPSAVINFVTLLNLWSKAIGDLLDGHEEEF